jgi:Family of unknown function (DUF6069)
MSTATRGQSEVTSAPNHTSTRAVLGTGVLATALGAAVLFGYGVLARAGGVPMRAGNPGAAHASVITPANFSLGVVCCGLLGSILAAVLAQRASAPARTFVRVAVVLVAISLADPALAAHTAVSTKLILAGGHLLAAAIAVPIIARRIA